MDRASFLIPMGCGEVEISIRIDQSRSGHVPKEILLDGADGIDRSHVGLDTQNLQAQAGSLLNHLVCVIRVLLGYRIRLPLDIRGDVLVARLASVPEARCVVHTFRAMKIDRGPAIVKIPVGFTEVT